MNKLFIIIIFMVTAIHSAADNNALADSHDTPIKATGLILGINMRTYDPNTGELFSSATIDFPGSLMNSIGELQKSIIFAEQYTTGNSILTIQNDSPFKGFNSSLALTNETDDAGSQFYYPFDRHVTRMKFYIAENRVQYVVPLSFKIDCSKCNMEGFSFNIKENINSDLSHSLTIWISHTYSTKVFCIVVSISMLFIAVCILIMALRGLSNQHRPEAAVLGFIGGLLFALPAVRNLQPMAPPMGVLIDYCGFFEAEFFLIVALIITITCWLYKPPENKNGKKVNLEDLNHM